MQIKGLIYKVLPIETGNGSKGEWKKQGIVIEIPDAKYPKKVAIELWNNLTKLPFEVGKELEVQADVESREHNGKWYTTIKAYKVVSNDSKFEEKQDSKSPVNESSNGSNIADDDSGDLPF